MRDTQQMAFKGLTNVEKKRAEVLAAIKISGGVTLFQLTELLQWPINRISGRVTELSKFGFIQDSGKRLVNPNSGKSGIVWITK